MSADREQFFMRRALELAAGCESLARPNPGVGCVLVNDGRILAEGSTGRVGDAHAEVNALECAGEAARGATAYVTLEPCCHYGRTPPCTDALIAAGIRSVVFAMTDPNPKVANGGLRALEAAGVEVRSGLLASAAGELNRGYVKRMRTGVPRVRVKVAASLDGATAMADGMSQWITGADARTEVQELRAAAGAILTGRGTVDADDPALTVRDPRYAETPPPLRVVLDSTLASSPTAAIYTGPGDTIIFCIDDERRNAWDATTTQIVRVAATDNRPDLHAVLAELGRREINDVLVEAGAELSGQLIEYKLVDEFRFFLAPTLLGSNTRPVALTPSIKSLADGLALELGDVHRVGADLSVTAWPLGRTKHAVRPD